MPQIRPKRKVVISLHGIRTRGEWQKNLAPFISEQGWIYHPLDYDYFSVLRFSLPSSRQKKVEWFRDEYNSITDRYGDVIPSIVAHSNGSYIVSKALKSFPIRFDKVILCGSIVRPDFDWATIFREKKATQVLNDIGQKDTWAGRVSLIGKDVGPSGKTGFKSENPRLVQRQFEEYNHSSAFSPDHYKSWVSFLNEPVPYEGESEPPWHYEEPVSPIDAARWSAITYFHQYIGRVNDALARGEVFLNNQALDTKGKVLTVIIPMTPGAASKAERSTFFEMHSMQEILVGKTDKRSVYVGKDGNLYDIPTTLNSLSYLDHRRDNELGDAVNEFSNQLKTLISSPKSECRQRVSIRPMSTFAH